jgi:benzylsuccinate CoA-transferase BbsF subunit
LRDPEVFESDEWHDPLFRRMNGDVIRLVAGDLMRDRSRAELFEEARTVGATLGIVHLPDEYVDHEQTHARGVFSRSDLPGLEGAPLVRPPLRFSVTPGRPAASPAVHLDDPTERWPRRAAESPTGSAGLLLDGIRVVEFGMAAVGPEVSMVLSELGADVIKVESSVHLDVLRLSGFDHINCGFAFNAECRGRRSVALNLDTERGRELAFTLCAVSDVVVENFRGGVLDRMGLDYEAIKGSNPGVVYASSQGYGRDGPLAEMPAYGPLNLAFVGLHHLWNHPEAQYPCGTSLNHPDHLAGKFLAGAVLCALEHRRRTGQGQRIDMAQTDLAAYLRGEVYVESWLNGTPVAAGNSSVFACPHGVFPSDGDDTWVAVSVAGDDEWQALCEVAGWELDAQLASLDGRLSQADKIEARLSAWTAARPALEAAAALQSRGVSAIPVMGPLDHLADDHLDARNFIVELEHPEVGRERHAGNPIRMSLTEQHVAASAPCLGAHTAEVLADVLGMDAAEIDLLIADGVCV